MRLLMRPGYSTAALGERRLEVGAFVADRYDVREHLGRDMLAEIYRAFDVHEGRSVRLQVLHAHLFGGIDSRMAAVEQIRKASEQIQSRYWLPTLDTAVDRGRVYVTEPWPTGVRMRDLLKLRLRRRAGFTTTEVFAVAGQLARALESVPEGVFHGEVRAEQVWIDRTHLTLSRCHILPVLPRRAVQRALASDKEAALRFAPEVRGAETLSSAADRFGVAMIVLEALTGDCRLPETLAGVSNAETLLTMLQRLLDAVPSERPPKLDDLLQALASAGGFELPTWSDDQVRQPASVYVPFEPAHRDPSLFDGAPEEEAETMAVGAMDAGQAALLVPPDDLGEDALLEDVETAERSPVAEVTVYHPPGSLDAQLMRPAASSSSTHSEQRSTLVPPLGAAQLGVQPVSEHPPDRDQSESRDAQRQRAGRLVVLAATALALLILAAGVAVASFQRAQAEYARQRALERRLERLVTETAQEMRDL